MSRVACQDTLITKKRHLSQDYFSLTFSPVSRADRCGPGQFIHLLLPSTDVTFRRAFSVASVSEDSKELEIIFRVVGRGTTLLADLAKGDRVNILAPLGNGFTIPRKSERVLLIGGGIGFPPMLFLASRLLAKGHAADKIVFFYGGRSKDDLLERTRIKKLGVRFHPVTEDGSFGEKGLVTQPVERVISETTGERMRMYACGPEPMLKAVETLGVKYGIPGEISVEAPMPCGFGVCLGCVLPLTAGGYTRVCTDGPVYPFGEVAL